MPEGVIPCYSFLHQNPPLFIWLMLLYQFKKYKVLKLDQNLIWSDIVDRNCEALFSMRKYAKNMLLESINAS